MATRRSRKKHPTRRSSSSKAANQAQFKMMLYIAMTLVGVLLVLNLINQNYASPTPSPSPAAVSTY